MDESSVQVAVTQLASTFFDTPSVRLFLQTDSGWSDGQQELTSEHSIIAAAALSGKTIATTTHRMTVVDERMMETIASNDAISIPILLDDDPTSCAAVLLVGLPKSTLTQISGHSLLIKQFQSVSRAAFKVSPGESISLDELDLKTRELIHEANNPLSTVQNYLKVLSLKLGPEHEATDTIDTIAGELHRTASIIQTLQTYWCSRGEH